MATEWEKEGAVESRGWVLSSYVREGLPTSEHLKIQTVRLEVGENSIPHGHVAVQLLWLSVDPYLRTMMSGHKDGLYLPQYHLNQTIFGFGVGRVIASKVENYKRGDLVSNPCFPVAEYCVVETNFLRKIYVTDNIFLLDYITALGIPGFTAWLGLQVIEWPKPGENVFVSAAAGAVGLFAGQLAKIKGCRVVGSTGTDEKVKLLKDEFGFDDAFNYKRETDLDAALGKYFPRGIDFYFDNVGGRTLEAVLNHVNKRARIPLCGMISQYDKEWSEREGVRNLLNMVGKEVRMEGFMVGSYMQLWGDFTREMEEHLKQRKLKCKHQVYKGIGSFLESLASLFTSSNVGKVVIQVHNEMDVPH